MIRLDHLLLWIIGGIGEETWKNTASDAIWTCYNDTMMICIDELVVEDTSQYAMHQFSAAVSQDIRWRAFTCKFFVEVVKGIGQLKGDISHELGCSVIA